MNITSKNFEKSSPPRKLFINNAETGPNMKMENLIRIGVFYDGNFFYHVSNYYLSFHQRRTRISIGGLHNFIRHEVAKTEGCPVEYCQIVDAHYFRGRLRASEASQRGDLLLKERQFDDVLIREGVTTHYLPLGPDGEKGIDVWFALESYESALHKNFDVTVLVASDGDFLPLVRKLNTLGTRVMLLGWDFCYRDISGCDRETKTSQALLDEVTYPIMMQQVINDRSRKDDLVVNGLFLNPMESFSRIRPHHVEEVSVYKQEERFSGLDDQVSETGIIFSLKDGYGFIKPDSGGATVFFHHSVIRHAGFDDLKQEDRVSFQIAYSEKGPSAVHVERADRSCITFSEH